MSARYYYYDQVFESEIALGLSESKSRGNSDLHIAEDSNLFLEDQNRSYFCNQDLVKIKLEKIWACYEPSRKSLRIKFCSQTSMVELTQILIDEVFPIVTFLNGALEFHASAVCKNGRAICLLGHSGAGKSTLAAEFLKRDFQLIDDDRILLRIHDSDVRVLGNDRPIRLVQGGERFFDISEWVRLGHCPVDGKQHYRLPSDKRVLRSSCRLLVLLLVGPIESTDKSSLAAQFIPVLERIPLSWFFTEYYGDKLMQRLESISNQELIYAARTNSSEPGIIVDRICEIAEGVSRHASN